MWSKTSQGKPSSGTPQAPSSPSVAPTASQSSPAPVASTPAAPPASEPVASMAPLAPAERHAAPVASAPSRIGSGLKIHGEISGNSDLYIDGEMQGKIRLANSEVTIGPNGKIQSDIEARSIVIEGSVNGNLKASENVRLGPASRLQGSVLTPRIGIDDGARLRGKVEMVRASPASTASVLSSASQPASQAQSPVSSGTASNDSDVLRPVTANAKDE
jgi:cytoskeletal protein CcmA (bactofilin family)